MATAGIVVTLGEGLAAEQAVAWLASEPRLEAGPRVDRRMALVLTTAGLAEGEAICRALLDLPGVVNVEVAYLATDDAPTCAEAEAPTGAMAS